MKQITGFWLMILLVGFSLSSTTVHASAQSDNAPLAVVLTSNGPLTPVLAEYLARGIASAQEQNATLIILALNTPGGSIDLMNTIVQEIRSSPIPVVVYVSPQNAMAGSAGTIITLAGHVAAMAPETTIGAASPVGTQGEDIGAAMESKVKEMLKASVRSLTTNRGPEAVKLAEETIDNARAVTADEALQIGLVDVIANNVPDLLNKLNGRTVQMTSGSVTLNTQNAILLPIGNTFIEELLQLLVNPNLVFLLLAIGVQAILIELSSPGGWVAGFIGVVCLLLATYGLGILPVNWFGILFIALAFALFILELKTPIFGALTAAGAVSFIIGALILFNSVQIPGFQLVSVPLVVGTSIFIALTFLGAVTLALRAQRTPIKMGRETFPDKIGVAKTDLSPDGMVQVGGELWSAETADGEPLLEGSRVQIERIDGLRLIVKKADR